MKKFVVLVFLGTLSLVASQAQNPPPASDPRALALAAQSIAALTGGTPISDVTLSGNATWIAGSDNEIGSVTLMAKGTGESRVDLNLSGGTRTDIRNDTAGDPGGASATNGGSLQLWAFHNCWTTASWFFPALSSLSGSNPNIVLSYVGLENRSSNSLHHIRSYRYLASSHTQVTTVIQQLSTVDFYLDAKSLLPITMIFNVHPDDDENLNIPVEVDFTNYQSSSGVQVPMHIQKYLQGGLVLDITVTGISVNSGLSDSAFQIQ